MKRCKHFKPDGSVVDGCGWQGETDSSTCACGGMLRSVMVDAQIAEQAKLLERARVVGVLDAWREKDKFEREVNEYSSEDHNPWTYLVKLTRFDFAPRYFEGPTPDAARAAAAKAIEAGEV